MKRIVYAIVGLWLVLPLANPFALQAQVPSNDLPCGAIGINPGGCIDGTTTGANDDTPGQGVGADCQSHGNNIDVWYTFVANNTGFNFQVFHDTTLGGTYYTASSVDLILYRLSAFSACDTAVNCLDGNACLLDDLVPLACWEDDGSRMLDGSVGGLIPGERYYFLVSSATVGGENPGTFRVCFDNLVYTPPPSPNCADAQKLCDASSFHNAAGGYAPTENITTNSCFGSTKNAVKWYQVTFATSGTFGFNIVPDAPADYDWLVWNTTLSPCNAVMPAPDGCNWSGCSGPTGMDNLTNDCTGNPSINYDAFGDAGASPYPLGPGLFNVNAGETYTILIDNWSAGAGYTFNFSNDMTAIIGPQAGFSVTNIACTPTSVEVEAQADVITPGFLYSWDMGDGTVIEGVTNVSHTYGTLGAHIVTLTVVDTAGSGTCIQTVQQSVDCPLPEIFASVEARAFGQDAKIQWTIPSNLPTSGFEVQRSTDLQNFITIADVREGEYRGGYIGYSFVDESVSSPSAHYRIRHYDQNGVQTNSDIMLVDFEQAASRTLVKIVDMLGREVASPQAGKVYLYLYSDGTTQRKIIYAD